MGMHDRDYYREDYAKKNGKRYDARRGVYYVQQEQKRDGVTWPKRLLLFLAICAAVFYGLRFLNSLV